MDYKESRRILALRAEHLHGTPRPDLVSYVRNTRATTLAAILLMV